MLPTTTRSHAPGTAPCPESWRLWCSSPHWSASISFPGSLASSIDIKFEIQPSDHIYEWIEVLRARHYFLLQTRRIRRRKSCNRKFHPALVTEQPSRGQVGGGINRQDAEEFETDDRPDLSSSLPSESKRTDCTVGEIVSGYGSETSGPVRRQTNVQETGADKRQPRRLVTVALSLLSHRGIHVFLTVVGVTAAWGKTCAILFTSVWLYSIFFRRIAARRAYSSSR